MVTMKWKVRIIVEYIEESDNIYFVLKEASSLVKDKIGKNLVTDVEVTAAD